NSKRCIGGKGCGDHGCAGEPPGDAPSGYKEIVNALVRTRAIAESDSNIECEIGGDNRKVDPCELHRHPMWPQRRVHGGPARLETNQYIAGRSGACGNDTFAVCTGLTRHACYAVVLRAPLRLSTQPG